MMFEWIEGGSTTNPAGFAAGAATCGLKRSGAPDLALLVSESDCSAAGVFTRNQIAAAPVLLDRETLALNPGQIRAVVANAGIANAATGADGLDDARAMQRLAAESLSLEYQQVLVLSTGVIGPRLPLDKLEIGITEASKHMDPANGSRAARAIMTTDTVEKHAALTVNSKQDKMQIGGMAKGSGMIHPDMATLLAVLTTDAALPADWLKEALVHAVNQSFNRISIDGDTSTNDSVLLLANGASGVAMQDEGELDNFQNALTALCQRLAKSIVRDGEGANKLVTIEVSGARSEDQAVAIGRTISASPLVKTAIAGGDPNWGRILAAAGRAGPALDPESLQLSVSHSGHPEILLVEAGAQAIYDESEAAAVFGAEEFTIHLALGLGTAATTIWTCDLTAEYIEINAEYRT